MRKIHFSDADDTDDADFIFISQIKNPPNPLNPRLKNEYRIRIKETASSCVICMPHLLNRFQHGRQIIFHDIERYPPP